MRLNPGFAIGMGVLLAAGSALAQPPTRRASHLPGTPAAVPHTLNQALAESYASNPTLLAARAQLRATDEQVPQALAGWRPTVTLSGGVGYADGDVRTQGTTGAIYTRDNRDILTGTATVTQPLYRGGKTLAQTHQATNTVMAQRASLLATEQTVLTDTVNAYVGVIEAEQVVQLDKNNEDVLRQQLQATRDRFRVGEITRTDVAQAEAALAAATATRQTAEGNLQTARATFQQVVGVLPGKLDPPQPLALPVKTEEQARRLAVENNPNVVSALFNEAAAKDAVDVAFSNLMPTISLQGTAFRQDNTQLTHERIIGGQITANLAVPIYQGGAEYAAVRAAKQTAQQQQKVVNNARRTALAQAVQAWETLQAAGAAIKSARAAISANQVALDGVEREAIVGSRTTQDVLNAQQALLNSQVTLVQNLASYITASYGVAAAIGRLTAQDLRLNVPYYDYTAYYKAVRDKLWGVGDAATNQPGR